MDVWERRKIQNEGLYFMEPETKTKIYAFVMTITHTNTHTHTHTGQLSVIFVFIRNSLIKIKTETLFPTLVISH